MSTDAAIETELQAKGLTFPRVTPASIEERIGATYYITGAEAAAAIGGPEHQSLGLLTICILVMRNGFTVLGKSACASPENFDPAIGRVIARKDAVDQVWALEGYLLKSKLAAK